MKSRPVSQGSAILAVVSCTFGLIACGGAGSDSGDSEEVLNVVETFLQPGNPDEVCDILHPNLRSVIENASESGACSDAVNDFGAGDPEVETGQVELSNDRATVAATGSSGGGYEGEFRLIKEDGDWKIIDIAIQTVLTEASEDDDPGVIETESTTSTAQETDCGTVTFSGTETTIVALRGVECSEAVEVTAAYDTSSPTPPEPWDCGLAHEPFDSYPLPDGSTGVIGFSCGSGGSGGDLKAWPHAFIGVLPEVEPPAAAAKGPVTPSGDLHCYPGQVPTPDGKYCQYPGD